MLLLVTVGHGSAHCRETQASAHADNSEDKMKFCKFMRTSATDSPSLCQTTGQALPVITTALTFEHKAELQELLKDALDSVCAVLTVQRNIVPTPNQPSLSNFTYGQSIHRRQRTINPSEHRGAKGLIQT
jgi:hypothetical protein